MPLINDFYGEVIRKTGESYQTGDNNTYYLKTNDLEGEISTFINKITQNQTYDEVIRTRTGEEIVLTFYYQGTEVNRFFIKNANNIDWSIVDTPGFLLLESGDTILLDQTTDNTDEMLQE